jgi:hypothetical protein
VKVFHAITTTDGNIALCAGHDVHIDAAVTLTRGTTIPAQSLGLPVGLTLIAGADGSGPGAAAGTIVFAPLTPPVTVTVAPVTINYNPVSYSAPTDFGIHFTLTEGATLTQRMLLFPEGTKVADGTNNAVLSGFRTTAESGLPAGVTLVAGPNAVATFDSAGAGSDIGITFSGYSLAGPNADQYALAGSCCVSTFRTGGRSRRPRLHPRLRSWCRPHQPRRLPAPTPTPPTPTPPPPAPTPPPPTPTPPPVVTPPPPSPPPVVVPPTPTPPPVVVPPTPTPPVVTPPTPTPPVATPPPPAPPPVVVVPPVVTPPVIAPPVVVLPPAPARPIAPIVIGQLPGAVIPVGVPQAANLAVVGPGVRVPVAQLQATRPAIVKVPVIATPQQVAPVTPRRRPVYAPRQDRN